MKKKNALVVCLLAGGLLLASCGAAETPAGDSIAHSSEISGGSHGGESPSQSGSSASSQSANTQRDNLKTLEQLEAVIGHHFHFEYYPNSSLTENSFTQSEILKYATDGTYTATYELIDRLWINIGDMSHQYQRGSSGTFLELASPVTPVVSVAEGAAAKTMLVFHDSIEYTKKETTTFLNRAATKYTLEISEGSQQQGQFYQLFTEVIIDNATGLALRHYSRQSGNMNMRTLPINFELAALNLGADADAFIATKTAKIGVYDWDTDFFELIGLTNVARPNEPFWYANRIIGTTGDNFSENIETIFHFTGTKEETMTKGRALVEAFYNAGLKYDGELELASSYDYDSIYGEDEEDGDIWFDAYTADGSWVDFDIEYLSNLATPYSRVTLDFYKAL